MRNRAINALVEMGMPANINGFHYIVDAVCLINENKLYMSKTGLLYEQIAQRNVSSYQKVERAIRYAFSCVMNNRNEAIDKYLPSKNKANGKLLSLFYLQLIQEE